MEHAQYKFQIIIIKLLYSKQNSKDQASMSLSHWWNNFKNQSKIYF